MKLHQRLAMLLSLIGGVATAQTVVISQVYGGGGNTGAVFANDFVEVFNRGATPVDLTGMSLQYASATGAGNFGGNSPVPLTGTLAPGQYRLVAMAGGAVGSPLPPADQAGSINLSGTAGKVVLVTGLTGLPCNGGSTPCSPSDQARIVDLVGYGSANFFEGSPAPALTNATAALRAAGGCQDGNHNASDFSTAGPNPRNSASPAQPCAAAPSAPIVTNCPALELAAGAGGGVAVGARDADGIVDRLTVLGILPAGLSVDPPTTATGVGGSAGTTVRAAPSTAAGSYLVTLRWGNDQGQTADCAVRVDVASVTRIPTIQGRAATSPIAGQTVLTEGVVTRVTNNGYFLQDPTGDADPLTSDGLFVFNGSAPKPLPGQLLRVSGTVTEFNVGAAGNPFSSAAPLTELTNPGTPTVVRSGVTVEPVSVDLLDPLLDLERYEGMLVTIPGPLTVSQNFFLGRFGQLTLSAGGRLETPTNRFRPGAAARDLAERNARRSLLLDDGSSLQNPNPIPYLGGDQTVRAGDTVAALTGVIDYGLAAAGSTGPASYRLQPTRTPTIARTNPRTPAPDAVGGNLKVASFNVLNYFTAFVDGSTADGRTGQGCSLGGSVAASNCRGANNAAEFDRQRRKIVEALAAIDADIVGLIEIQNNGTEATRDLVEALNTRLGGLVYDVVPEPATGSGTDAIKLAFIYKPSKVTRVGEPVTDTDAVHNRPPLAQTFAAPNGERVSVIVNHFKSKGCGGAVGADLDQGDLQGCFNEQRLQQAQALRTFVEGVQAMAQSDDVLVLGDLNAYAKEDPIHELTALAGHVDEIGKRDAFGYSFTFDGASGRLDHALATPTLSPKVTGATVWHVNTDEPSVIDYNTEFKPPSPDLYTATSYRSSDHDPVVVGLGLVKTIDGSAKRDRIVGSPGDDVITAGAGPDLISGGAGADLFVFSTLRGGVDMITDFTPGQDRIDLRPLRRGAGAPAGRVTDGAVRVLPMGTSSLIQLRTTDGPKRRDYRTVVILRAVEADRLLPARDFLY